MLAIRLLRCPVCSFLTKVDIGFIDILGPPIFICKRCQSKVPTHLREWNALSIQGRIEYIAVSILAVIFGSYFLAASMYIALTDQLFSDSAWYDFRFLTLYIGIGVLTALIKILCVSFSKNRTKNDDGLVKVSLTTWYMNIGLYYTLAVVFLICLDYYFIYEPKFRP